MRADLARNTRCECDAPSMRREANAVWSAISCDMEMSARPSTLGITAPFAVDAVPHITSLAGITTPHIASLAAAAALAFMAGLLATTYACDAAPIAISALGSSSMAASVLKLSIAAMIFSLASAVACCIDGVCCIDGCIDGFFGVRLRSDACIGSFDGACGVHGLLVGNDVGLLVGAFGAS
mmetsp:Transcript_31256/g.85471  ORF Transcript_31256/g.85471 Transcript_31256/m.85471 type:complete len:181 (-) Transcript_31256:1240-1782(-)